MDNFNFYSPTYFAFGQDRESDAGKLVRRFGGTKVLIHYGGGSAVRSGLIGRIEKSLTDAGLEFIELGGVKPNPVSSMVYRGIELCRSEEVDFVLAVGGGSVIDSSKAIAAGVLYDGDFWDFYMGKPVDEALPVGTVLTISAAGSEGSGDSVITKEEGMFKRGASGDGLRPRFSVLNPALTETLPPFQTACGITDIIAHLLERYMTNSTDVQTTDRLIEGLLLAMLEEGPKAIAKPDDYQARANIMWAGMVAHNNIVGVGRSQDWTSHDIEHELSAEYDCAHGAGLAVCIPAVMTYNLNHDPDRFTRFAANVMGCTVDPENPMAAAIEGIQKLKEFFISLGMPANFKELGAREEDIEKLAHRACYGNGRDGHVGGFVSLDEKDVTAIYRLMI